jgi:hypothetical protein
MAGSDETRRLQASDVLYRVVFDGQYEGDRIDPAAFDDKYEKQSFYLQRIATPFQVLASLAGQPRVKRKCGTGTREPTPGEMYTAGYRVAEIRYQVFIDLRVLVHPHTDGSDFRPDGHVNMIDAKSHATRLSRTARMLTREETLSR